MGAVTLRPVSIHDLPVFFEQQLDADANRMAAFTARDPADRAAFDAHWARILVDEAVRLRTIMLGGAIAGNIAHFEQCGRPSVSYWIAREHWGKGVATAALTAFLAEIEVRPLYARAANDNVGSLRVLEKCGFVVYGRERGFANARGEEIDELMLELRG